MSEILETLSSKIERNRKLGDFMVLSQKQERAVSMLFIAGMLKKDIAEKLKITPATLSVWQKQPEFQEAMRVYGLGSLIRVVPKLGNHLFELALSAKSEMVQLQATRDLLDRADFRKHSPLENSLEEFVDNGFIEALNAGNKGLWKDEEKP